MVATTSAAVRRALVGDEDARTSVSWYGIGLLGGAALTGSLLVVVNGLIDTAGSATWVAASVGVVSVGWAAATITGEGRYFPRRRWQVPEQWRSTMPLDGSLLLYGAILGMGVWTDVVLPTLWFAMLVAVLFASPWAVIASWLAYAATRFVMTATVGMLSGEEAHDRFLVVWRTPVWALNALSILGVGAVITMQAFMRR